MSSFQPVEVLKNRLSTNVSGGVSLRKALIILQFAIVQMFVIGTIVIAVQMHYIRNKELGFNREALLTIPIPDNSRRGAIEQQLVKHSAIEKISFNSGPPTVTERRLGTSYWLSSGSVAESFEAEMKCMDENYLYLYGLILVAGRNFTRTGDMFDEFIVNEKLIKAFEWTPDEALGRQLIINEGKGIIVGVVKDFHNNSMQEAITPCVMMNWNAFFDNASLQLSAINSRPVETLQFIEKTWKEFFPQQIYEYTFIDDFLEQNYILENLIFDGFIVFSFIAVLIGCFGLYGLIRFMTVRRSKEVGIRKVLGASVVGIFMLFSKEFVFLVLIALVFASPIAWYAMQQWLSGFAYSVDISWWMFAGGGVLAMVIALVTISFQTVRTAVMDPVKWLRCD
jgi:hypothetical protein